MSHYLYRLYDAAGVLLYVGISKSAIHRLHQHLEARPWADQIASQTVERFASREAVEQAERSAIKAEKPLHNKTHAEPPKCDCQCHTRKKARRRRRGLYGVGSVKQLPSGNWLAMYREDGRYRNAPSTFSTEREAWDWLLVRYQDTEASA